MSRFILSENLCKRRDTIQSSSNAGCFNILCTDINNANLLAVSYSDRTVAFFDADGKHQTTKTIRNKTCNATILKWSPSRTNIIALAMTNGVISLWNCNTDEASSQPTQWVSNTENPSGATFITALLWNDSGTHLVAGSHAGSCFLWEFNDHQLTLSFVADFSSPEYRSITKAVFYRYTGDLNSKNPNFLLFFGTSNGKVVQADSDGNHAIIESATSSIDNLMIYHEKKLLVVLTKSCMLIQIHITTNSDISTNENNASPPVLSNIELRVSDDTTISAKNTIWVGQGVIANTTGEGSVTFWDINTNQSYVLPLIAAASNSVDEAVDRAVADSALSSDVVIATCVAFHPLTGYLVASTSIGSIFLWRHCDISRLNCYDATNGNEKLPWIPIFTKNIGCKGNGIQEDKVAIKLQWSSTISAPRFFIQREASVSVVQQLELKVAFHSQAVAVQVTSNIVAVQYYAKNDFALSTLFTVQVPESISVEGLAINEEHLVIWGRRTIHLYRFCNEQLDQVADFMFSALSVVLYCDMLYVLLEDKILIITTDGVQRFSISLGNEDEGLPILMSIKHHFLVVATELGFLKVFDVSQADPSLVGKSIALRTDNPNMRTPPSKTPNTIRSVECNSTGMLISIITIDPNKSSTLSNLLYLVNVSSGNQRCVKINDGEKLSHFWDQFEPHVFCCETDTSETETTVEVFFVSSELDLFSQDKFNIEKGSGTILCGVHAPQLAFCKPNDYENGNISERIMLKDFSGNDHFNRPDTQILIKFAFSLAIGDIDVRSMLLLELSQCTWEKMAVLSVKKRRQDIVDICLAKMGHVQGLAVITCAKKESEKNAALAAAAIQLGLLNEAELLYKDCGRFDLLSDLYMRQCLWEKAFKAAEEHDQLHLKFCYHQHAKYCCESGNIKDAISSFEKAGTNALMVPRILIDRKLPDVLRKYVLEKRDKKLTVWWASYCESIGNHDEASEQFALAGDFVGVLRIACNRGDLTTASDVVLQSGNAAAAFQLARFLERSAKIHDAIQFYIKSGVIRPAVRLCKSHSEESNLLMSLAMESDSDSLVLESATFFYEKEDFNKAAELFNRGGKTAKALSIWIASEQSHDVIRRIVTSITGELSQTDIDICSSHLIKNGMYEEAVLLLLRGPDTLCNAVQLCVDHNIQVTENTLSLVMGHIASMSNVKDKKEEVNEILMELGKLSERQGQYVLGCKAYTKAGDPIRAMKSLLQSGDAVSITSYALVSRAEENYVLAASYLQRSLVWKNDEKITNSIVQLYTLGKAFVELAHFFEVCSDMEIDEYGDYEKALAATEETRKALYKLTTGSRAPASLFDWLSVVNQRVNVLKRFVAVSLILRKDGVNSSEKEVAYLELIQDQQKTNGKIIRFGDFCSLLVEYFVTAAKVNEASKVMEDMLKKGLVLDDYIELQFIKKVEALTGINENLRSE